jgi:DNA invertase Pin-like site-specific DNA recombinase
MAGKRVGLYLRVSTTDQTIENQRRELTEACERRGWTVVAEFSDDGISGSKGRDARPGFDRLNKAMTQGGKGILKIASVGSGTVQRIRAEMNGLT